MIGSNVKPFVRRNFITDIVMESDRVRVDRKEQGVESLEWPEATREVGRGAPPHWDGVWGENTV